jgi:tRNA pseudouridine38-40 synthase
MPRYRLLIEYDGTAFVGWQAQDEGRSVQAALEDAILAFSGERLRLSAAGRTDSGVHAEGQVAHLDLARDWPPDVVRDAVNAHLKRNNDAVVVVAAAPEAADFDARFSAIRRRYRYRILARRAPSPLLAGQVWHIPRPLDLAAMQEAAAHLVGCHDFTTFRAAACQARSPVKTLDLFACDAFATEIRFRAEARSFMHNQVRSMVGTIVEVGLGRWRPADVAAALDARDRTRCGPVAPARGLCLVGVDYPDRPAAK